ncbi:hypothetical protein EXIGLDRAFT_755590 [Exidia glandulosa HHB12029]|uniref:Mid2 domain-containing protein n=1 Tax=Exidia glandulosa HHB12029 TaxID=1314781 RepID=A0A165BXL2_EXIGL|nr:hypothetical protein EXIGLDRAFT_755590 [Exidia glandulosa HHB12029]
MSWLRIFGVALAVELASVQALAATRTIAAVDLPWKTSGRVYKHEIWTNGTDCDQSVRYALVLDVGARAEYAFPAGVSRVQLVASGLGFEATGAVSLISRTNGAAAGDMRYIQARQHEPDCFAPVTLTFANLSTQAYYTLSVTVTKTLDGGSSSDSGGPHPFLLDALHIDEDTDSSSVLLQRPGLRRSGSEPIAPADGNESSSSHTISINAILFALGAVLGGLGVLSLIGLYFWHMRRRLREANLHLMMYNYEPADFGSEGIVMSPDALSPGFDSQTTTTRTSGYGDQRSVSFMSLPNQDLDERFRTPGPVTGMTTGGQRPDPSPRKSLSPKAAMFADRAMVTSPVTVAATTSAAIQGPSGSTAPDIHVVVTPPALPSDVAPVVVHNLPVRASTTPTPALTRQPSRTARLSRWATRSTISRVAQDPPPVYRPVVAHERPMSPPGRPLPPVPEDV